MLFIAILFFVPLILAMLSPLQVGFLLIEEQFGADLDDAGGASCSISPSFASHIRGLDPVLRPRVTGSSLLARTYRLASRRPCLRHGVSLVE